MRAMAIPTALVTMANLTCRSAGAVGSRALVPRHVRALLEELHQDATVLDYGAGEYARHAEDMRRDLRANVTSWEFGMNFRTGIHDPTALQRRYDVVYASNVLNVQGDRAMLVITLGQLAGTTKPTGVCVVNYPKTPRYLDIPDMGMEGILKVHFDSVVRVKVGSGYVWECRRPLS